MSPRFWGRLKGALVVDDPRLHCPWGAEAADPGLHARHSRASSRPPTLSVQLLVRVPQYEPAPGTRKGCAVPGTTWSSSFGEGSSTATPVTVTTEPTWTNASKGSRTTRMSGSSIARIQRSAKDRQPAEYREP